MAGAPDLRAIYHNLYDTLPWPEPIPHPAQVIFRWSRHITCQLGSCNRIVKMITVSPLYEDPRLREELPHLMAHEASHFIWPNHSKAFKEFLRREGVAPEYINGQTRTSETYKTVEAEWLTRHRADLLASSGSRRRRPVARQIALPFET